MKVILENATELLEAFEQLPYLEQQQFLVALQRLVDKATAQRDSSLNPEDFFGIWAGQNIDATQLRKEAWGDRT
ncbi:MAG: hypothetical protein EAZ95_04925 [Bacteroidetes bacterium]|nr:MAG: hypothetical protein EAZ95_04925 [Bacteroidota bacterium]